MQILRSIRRLPRRPNIAISPVPLHSLSSPSQHPSFMASPAPRWWLPELARRSFPLVAPPNPPVRRASGLCLEPLSMATISRVQGNESGKPYRRLPITSGKGIIISEVYERSAIPPGMKNFNTGNSKKVRNMETRSAISEVIDEDERSDKDACKITSEVVAGKHDAWGQSVNLSGCEEVTRSATKDHTAEIVISEGEEVSDDEGYTVNNILAESRHRDGSIYRGMDLWWKKDYCVADRNETRLEAAMRLSDPSDCFVPKGTCLTHFPRRMLQIFSIELAKLPVDGGLVELYGYIAVRDDLDPLLNYVVNISRDDPITVEQGSLIKMTGPKRGIYMADLSLVEYDLRIKTSEQEKDDLQVIDGASLISAHSRTSWPFLFEIASNCGAVDMTVSCLFSAFEATIEVVISEVQNSFDLSLGCLTSGFNEEIRLFDGTIAESRALKRFVVAVAVNSSIDLKFKVGAMSSSSDQHACSFMAKNHKHDIQKIKTDFTLISVKVTWSALM